MAWRLESAANTSATVWASAEQGPLKLGGTGLLLSVRKVLMKEEEFEGNAAKVVFGSGFPQPRFWGCHILWCDWSRGTASEQGQLVEDQEGPCNKDHMWGVLVLSHSLQEDAFVLEDSLPARVSSAQSAVGCEELVQHFNCCLSKCWFSKHCLCPLTTLDWGGSCKLPLGDGLQDLSLLYLCTWTNFLVGLWCVLGQQPQVSTEVGPSWQRQVWPSQNWRSRAGIWRGLTKMYGFTRSQCMLTHTEETLNAFRFACVHGLSEERKAYPDFGCAMYLTICSDTPGRCQLWK